MHRGSRGRGRGRGGHGHHYAPPPGAGSTGSAGGPSIHDRLGTARSAARHAQHVSDDHGRDHDLDMGGGMGHGAPDQQQFPSAQRRRFAPYVRGAFRGRGGGIAQGGPDGHPHGPGPNGAGMSPQPPPGVDANGAVDVHIKGYQGTQGATEESLIAFLHRKVANPIEIGAIRYEADVMIVTVRNWAQAVTLLKLSGIRFAGGKLFITLPQAGMDASSRSVSPTTSGRPPAGAAEVIQVLTQVVTNRFDPNAGFLNCEQLSHDPLIRQHNIESIVRNDEQSKVWHALCKLIGEKCPNVRTISFATNSFRTLVPLSLLPKFVPNLENLSLANNSLQSLRDIEPLKELTNLKELILEGNPYVTRELGKPGGEIRYRADIKRLVPSLTLLDQTPLLEEISFGVEDLEVIASAAALPLDVKEGFVDSPDTRGLIDDFVSRYFPLFDSMRASLVDIYHPDAIFSLHINPNPPPFKTQQRRREDFDGWRTINRNHVRTHVSGGGPGSSGATASAAQRSVEKREQCIFISAQEIVRALATLPVTQHPIQTRDKFVIDGWLTQDYGLLGNPNNPPAGPERILFMNMSGQFAEVTKNGSTFNRSFSRTFLIAPSAPGSRAHSAGFPYVILNDILCVRPWSGNRAFNPQSRLGTAQQPQQQLQQQQPQQQQASPSPHQQLQPGNGSTTQDSPAVAALRQQHGLNEGQDALVRQFSAATGLNYRFSLQCLAEHAWNGDAAFQAFQVVKPQIPQEAYQPM